MRDASPLIDLPEEVLEWARDLSSQFPGTSLEEKRSEFEGLLPTFRDRVDELVQMNPDIETRRAELGVGKGAAGALAPEEAIPRIWEMVSPHLPEPTNINRFLCFEGLEEFMEGPTDPALGIAGCCAVFDLVGFQAEKKSRRLDKIGNLRADAMHIAMASLTGHLATTDERLAMRARAIYAGREMATSQDFVAWIRTPALNPDDLIWLLVAKKESLLRFAKGSTHRTIYFPEVLALNIALPPRAEQDEIVSRVRQRLAMLPPVAGAINAAQRRALALERAVLAKAFKGELVSQRPREGDREGCEARPPRPTRSRPRPGGEARPEVVDRRRLGDRRRYPPNGDLDAWVSEAADWAREHCGLDFARLRAGGVIDRGLRTAAEGQR